MRREKDIAKAKRLLASLAERQARLLDALEQGSVTNEVVQSRLVQIRKERDEVEGEVGELRRCLPPSTPSAALVKRFIEEGRKEVLGGTLGSAYASRAKVLVK